MGEDAWRLAHPVSRRLRHCMVAIMTNQIKPMGGVPMMQTDEELRTLLVKWALGHEPIHRFLAANGLAIVPSLSPVGGLVDRLRELQVIQLDKNDWIKTISRIREFLIQSQALREEAATALIALEARVKEMEKAMTWVADAYEAEEFMRTGDMHRSDCRCLRCACDNARAASGERKTG